jgi:hypothetical protein
LNDSCPLVGKLPAQRQHARFKRPFCVKLSILKFALDFSSNVWPNPHLSAASTDIRLAKR